MSWERILQNDRPDEPLRQRIDALFAEQREGWPMLRDGEASLAHLQRKTLSSDGQSIVVQVNPARRRSTLAKTDSQSVAARRCFLCPDNMPIEERGVTFEDLVIMPNPYPVLPMHCTIAARQHQPQRIAGRIECLLRLAAELGPDLAAFYNGPRCGASAPDHFHFQAASARDISILSQLPAKSAGRSLAAKTSFGRNLLIAQNAELSEVGRAVEQAINALREMEQSSDEPMLNLLAYHDGGQYTAILFPRRAHRPACYFATDAEQLLISPAVLEMCGILVATEADHFEQINAEIARAIYREVSISDVDFERLVARVSD
jgi:Domain of unknown function (DUF4922)